jgi:hypothetical protein
MTMEDLKAFLDIPSSDTSQDLRIQECWTNAGELLTLATAKAFRVIPQSVLDYCQLRIGKDMFDSRNTTAGGSQFTTFEGVTSARAARDPLAVVAPVLAMYVVRY